MRQTSIVLACIMLLAGCSQTAKIQSSGKPEFDKIIFHTTRCFGTCPVYHLELLKDRAVRLYAEHVYTGYSFQDDSTKTGYFTGKADDSLFTRLNNEIASAGGLDSVSSEGPKCCDGTLRTAIIYYNGKRKLVKAMFPPEKTERIFQALMNICTKSSLTRSKEPFTIEGEKEARE